MKVNQSIHINAPADAVWAVLAHQFYHADRWLSSIYHSERRDAVATVGDFPLDSGGRACDTSLGLFRETVRHYDERKRSFGYEAEGDKMPFFVRSLQNNWTVTPHGNGSTVDMRLEARLLPVFAQLMGPVMKRQFAKVTTEAVEELKYYVERGEPHPRKVASDRERRAKAVA
ncbi:MAG: SRPBCC family protein [Bacteroidota bacterium]